MFGHRFQAYRCFIMYGHFFADKNSYTMTFYRHGVGFS